MELSTGESRFPVFSEKNRGFVGLRTREIIASFAWMDGTLYPDQDRLI